MRAHRRHPFAKHLVVQVRGPHLERFINACVTKGLRLWGVQRLSHEVLIVRMDAPSFRTLRHIDRRAHWEIRIVERFGGGFLLGRLLRRRAFFWGGVVAALVGYVLSLHIWFVTVEGTERVREKDVVAVAATAGLTPGALKSSIDAQQIQRALLLELHDLVWAGVEVRGTRAVITVSERRLPDQGLQGPGHIVASRDGIVERISVLAGTPVVEAGETVRAGQVLISGLLTPGSPEFAERIERGEAPYLKAEGSVRALVWHEAHAEAAVEEGAAREAERHAVDVALTLADESLAKAGAQPIGAPVVEVETVDAAGIIRVRVLVQAVQEIGVYEAVVP